ncbi:MAG: hypothetical protein M3Y83_15120 [Actinomycetota bacterium]|nr:hypothetical protein [Actinomycetota bacterium]
MSIACSVPLVYFIVRGTLAAVRGNYLTTILVFGMSSFPVLLMVALTLAAAGKTRMRTTSDATGLTVWPDKRFSALTLTGVTLLAPTSALFAYLMPRGVIDIPMSRGMQIFYPPMFMAASVIAVGGLVAVVRHGGLGHLKFTPAMIDIVDARRTRTLEWDDIVDVTDHSESKEGKSAGRSAVLCLRDGSERVIGNLSLYVPTGVPLYWLVRHYWRHPEDRLELVDGRAAERLRDGRFDLT